jgi:glycosyltransferase involved in cell wall biosynthesis
LSLPTVSVLLPNYNHGEYLAEALGAIAGQTARPTEVLVGDDASTDDSVRIAEDFAARDPLIRVVRNQTNMGALATIERLLEMSSGDYFISVAADDRMHPRLLERSLELLARHPEAGFSSALSRRIAPDGSDLGMFPTPVVADEPRYLPPAEIESLLPRDIGWFVMGNTVLWRRDAYLAAGGLHPELGSLSDYFLTMVLGLRHGACFVPEALADWRLMPTGMAATSGADPERLRALQETAVRLMTSDYSADFPPGYAQEWGRWQGVSYALAGLERRRHATLESVSQRRPALARPLRAAFAVEHAAVEVRETVRRRLPLAPMTRRRLRRLSRR